MINLPEASARSLVTLIDDPSSGVPIDGNLINKRPDKRLDFGFEYLGVPFAVSAEAKEQGTDIVIRANLGHLPYTAEDAERRNTALKILDAATADLGGRIRLSAKQEVIITEEIRLEEPLTPVVLLTRAATIVLRHKPYLQLISLVIAPPRYRSNLERVAHSNAN